MHALVQGDNAAFDTLLGRYLDRIHGYLLRLTGSTVDADDLAQETFLRLWSQAHRFDANKARFSTWLYRLAHNLQVDAARKRGEQTGSEDDVANTVATQTIADADTTTATDVRMQALTQALATLPISQRAAIALVYLQGFSNREAAHIMDLGVRAVESLLARARKTLHSQLNPETEHSD